VLINLHHTGCQGTATPDKGSEGNGACLRVSVIFIGIESCSGSANARYHENMGSLAA
jgi:hypothetical protein